MDPALNLLVSVLFILKETKLPSVSKNVWTFTPEPPPTSELEPHAHFLTSDLVSCFTYSDLTVISPVCRCRWTFVVHRNVPLTVAVCDVTHFSLKVEKLRFLSPSSK